MTFGPAIKIGVDVRRTALTSSSSSKRIVRDLLTACQCQQSHTVTPALLAARFAHLNDVCAKAISMPVLEDQRPQHRNLLALGRSSWWHTKAHAAFALLAVIGRLHEPAGNVVKSTCKLVASRRRHAADLLSARRSAISTAKIWRIPADVRLTAFVLEVDLRLIERRAEQVIGLQLHARSRRRADAQPVEPQRVAAGDPVLARRAAETRPAPPSARDRARRTDTRR